MALISKTGIANGSTIEASHITGIIDALDGTGTSTIKATISFADGTLMVDYTIT